MAEAGPQFDSTPLAWAGWQMQVPAQWRPLRIQGQMTVGDMLIGDGAQALMQVKWWRPRRSRFDPARWIQRRLRIVRADPAKARTEPKPSGFDPVAFVPADARAGRAACALWYGYSGAAQLVIEIAADVVPGAQEASERAVLRTLASLTAQNPAGPTIWAVFGSSFEVPAPFVLRQHSLLLGDLSLLFSGHGGQSLMVRQVYPADLALSRWTMDRWLRASRFVQRRRYRPRGHTQPWEIGAAGRRVDGLKCVGRMCLPFPLAWVRPRWTTSAAVHDRRTGRLLIAQHETPGPPDDSLVRQALDGMNRDMLSGIKE